MSGFILEFPGEAHIHPTRMHECKITQFCFLRDFQQHQRIQWFPAGASPVMRKRKTIRISRAIYYIWKCINHATFFAYVDAKEW